MCPWPGEVMGQRRDNNGQPLFIRAVTLTELFQSTKKYYAFIISTAGGSTIGSIINVYDDCKRSPHCGS